MTIITRNRAIRPAGRYRDNWVGLGVVMGGRVPKPAVRITLDEPSEHEQFLEFMDRVLDMVDRREKR